MPYLIGQHYGTPLIHKLVCKYPKIAELQKWEHHDFLHTFTIRAADFLPCDVVSMYMGASEVSYAPYLCGSLAGCFLNLLTTTILGVHIDHPRSPIFVASLIIRALLFLLSCCFYLSHILK